jgi:hypothetical protein
VVEDDTVFEAGDLEEIEMVQQADFAVFDATLGEDEEGYEFNYDEGANPPDLSEDFVPTLPDYVEGSHALCGIFSLLWQQRATGGVIEMQLSEGELLTPDYFSPELSKGSHGVFAMRGKDGVFTITSVAWESVLRVSLRKTPELPPGLFQE